MNGKLNSNRSTEKHHMDYQGLSSRTHKSQNIYIYLNNINSVSNNGHARTIFSQQVTRFYLIVVLHQLNKYHSIMVPRMEYATYEGNMP
jgi:phage-related protein